MRKNVEVKDSVLVCFASVTLAKTRPYELSVPQLPNKEIGLGRARWSSSISEDLGWIIPYPGKGDRMFLVTPITTYAKSPFSP